jgi:hypothetical protein
LSNVFNGARAWLSGCFISGSEIMSEDPGGDLEARYANSFHVGFNAYEFVIDFAQHYQPGPDRTHTRVVTSPALARDLRGLLENSLREYVARYGEPGPSRREKGEFPDE